MLSSSGTSLNAQCSSKSSADLAQSSRRRCRSKSGRIAFAHTDERKHTREVHVPLLKQGVDERKWEARKNSNVI
jgi:hypothetical protein